MPNLELKELKNIAKLLRQIIKKLDEMSEREKEKIINANNMVV